MLTDLGLKKGRGWFLNLWGLLWFYIKKIFLPVNAQLGWLDNVSDVPQAHFSLLISQQGLGHIFRHRPLLPIGWRILQTVRQ
jgi:hypothetical protein